MTPPARFISFEGIDGAGKSSHLERAAHWLRERGREVVVTREPGGTPLAEQLRTLLLEAPMDALTEALVVFAARRDHLQRLIEPALAAGRTVLCDRFADASFAYQGGGRRLDAAVLVQLERWVQQGRQPDLTVWFDLDAATAAARRGAARDPDRFEQQDTAFFERARQAYRERMQGAPRRIRRVDAGGPPEAVWQQVQRVLEEAA